MTVTRAFVGIPIGEADRWRADLALSWSSFLLPISSDGKHHSHIAADILKSLPCKSDNGLAIVGRSEWF
jgi:hypothetical protein